MSVENYLGITVDYSRDNLLEEQAIAMLTRDGFYKRKHEESPQQTFARASTCYSFGDYEFAQRIYDYVSNGWFTFASPVLSNATDIDWPTFPKEAFEEAGDWLEENVTPEGLPISCFLSHVGDNKESLVEARTEAAWLSMMGGGIGIGMFNRSPDEKSTGVMAHLKGYDADALSYKQGSTRRGSIAAYMDIDHPEIKSFLEMRDPVGGDANKKCFNLNNAVNIPDWFMEAVVDDKEYELRDPAHGATGRYLKAREVYELLLKMRMETGEPYINYINTVNKNIPEWITKATYHVRQSNLCNEVHLMTSNKRTAVCCLSSLNLEKFDEWKDSQLVADITRLLDNVLEYFIRLAPKQLKRAVYSAQKERAIGIGTLGFHSYLQKNMIPFESGGLNSAAQATAKIYSLIKQQAVAASQGLAAERGEPDDCFGSGMRNSHLLAIAPNASSSSLVGVSPSAELWAANIFNAQGRAGSFRIKNKYLERELEATGLNTDEVWKKIEANEGSCQDIAGLSPDAKLVFKTATEVNPQWVVELAAIRQQYVCQGQSVNLHCDGTWTDQEVSDIHFLAWKKGLKGLYYLRNTPAAKANVGTGGEAPLNAIPIRSKIVYEECLSCSG